MSAEALRKINHDAKDHGSLGGVELLIRRDKQLYIPNATRQTVQKYLWSEQAYTLHKPTRRLLTKNHTYVALINAQ